MVGNSPDKWEKYRVSSNIGCVAPKTVEVLNAPYELSPQSSRTLAVWQAHDGIYIFDGRGFTPIHGDISGVFDGTGSVVLNRSYVGICEGTYDSNTTTYHWRFPSGSSTTCNKEYCYDIKRRKWYEIVRGSSGLLQVGLTVTDTNQNVYAYGLTAAGFMYRLENGNSFPGSPGTIPCNFEFGDMALTDSVWHITKPRFVKLLSKGKTSTTTTVTMSHYADTVSTPETGTVVPYHATKRIAGLGQTDTFSKNFLDGTFHRFGFAYATSAEKGFEPKFVAIKYHLVRDDLK
jgi:hypothetical protein